MAFPGHGYEQVGRAFAARLGREFHSANEWGVCVARAEVPASSETWMWAQVVAELLGALPDTCPNCKLWPTQGDGLCGPCGDRRSSIESDARDGVGEPGADQDEENI